MNRRSADGKGRSRYRPDLPFEPTGRAARKYLPTWNPSSTSCRCCRDPVDPLLGRRPRAATPPARGSPRLEANLWSTRSTFARLPPDQCRPDLIRSVQSLADPLLVDALRRLACGEAGS